MGHSQGPCTLLACEGQLKALKTNEGYQGVLVGVLSWGTCVGI